MLHARSAFVDGPGLRDLHVGSCDWAGITPTQPSPIKGEGFRYPREGCVISFRRHDTSTRIALYRDDGAMPGESKVDGSSSASLLAGCFSLFSLAVPGCYLPPAPVKKRGFLRPRPASWLYFCGIYRNYVAVSPAGEGGRGGRCPARSNVPSSSCKGGRRFFVTYFGVHD